MFLGDLQHQPSKVLQIRSISYAKRNAESNPWVLITPIVHTVGNEVGVGHDDCNIIIRHDRRAPQADFANLSRDSANFDAVTDGYWPLGKNDQTADEIADDVLQTEAKANTDGSGNDCKGTEIDANDLETDIETKSKDAVAKDPPQGKLQGWGKMRPPQHTPHKVPPKDPLGHDNKAE